MAQGDRVQLDALSAGSRKIVDAAAAVGHERLNLISASRNSCLLGTSAPIWRASPALQDEWERIEAPLKRLDPELDRFAHKYGLRVIRNAKDEPERSLIWGTDVRCLIQVFLVDQSALTLNLWICASQDRDGNRFWKNETPRKEEHVTELAQNLFDLLEAGKRKLDQWSAHPEELEFTTKLGH